jgi:hypothetical protein
VEYLDPESINGLNLYAYCGNNPVNMVDSSGHAPWWVKLLIGIGAILVLGVITVVSAGVGGAALGVALKLAGSAMLAATKVAVIGGLSSGGIGALVGGITNSVNGGNFFEGAFSGFVEGFSSGFMISAIAASTSMSIAALKGNFVTQIGIMKPSNKDARYLGTKYQQKAPSGNWRYRSLELHGPHNDHGIHLQINKWNPETNSVTPLTRFNLLDFWRWLTK